MTKSAVIKVTGLSKHYQTLAKPIVAIDNITFTLYSHQMTLFKGPSGSGKSSVLSAISGLLKPDSGEVNGFGQDIWALNRPMRTRFRRKHCGFVFQKVGLFPALTAIEQIITMLALMNVPDKIARERALECLDLVGLSDRFDSKPGELSGGQNQRVAIARMLAKRPDLIFCDEPTSALDGKTGSNIAGLLRKVAKETGAMVFCVTHDDRLSAFADRIVEIEDGKIISDNMVEK